MILVSMIQVLIDKLEKDLSFFFKIFHFTRTNVRDKI